jgi:hypothetical protein
VLINDIFQVTKECPFIVVGTLRALTRFTQFFDLERQIIMSVHRGELYRRKVGTIEE